MSQTSSRKTVPPSAVRIDAEHVLLGPGKRPANVAEKLALKQRFADARRS